MPEEVIITADMVLVDEDGITIKFKPDPTGRPSESGKSMVVASTGGFLLVAGYKVSVNVIKKRK